MLEEPVTSGFHRHISTVGLSSTLLCRIIPVRLQGELLSRSVLHPSLMTLHTHWISSISMLCSVVLFARRTAWRRAWRCSAPSSTTSGSTAPPSCCSSTRSTCWRTRSCTLTWSTTSPSTTVRVFIFRFQTQYFSVFKKGKLDILPFFFRCVLMGSPF